MGRKRKIIKTLCQLLLDESGSMQSIAEETVSGVRKYVDELKDGDGEAYFSLARFEGPNYSRTDPVKITAKGHDPFDERPYVPGGFTPLNDGVGRTAKTIHDEEADYDQVIFVIVTDGMENASQEWTADAVRKMLEEKQNRKKDAWVVTFLGAGIDAWGAGGGLGMHRHSTVSIPHTGESISMAFFANTVATRRTRSSRAGGQSVNSGTYYTKEEREQMSRGEK